MLIPLRAWPRFAVLPGFRLVLADAAFLAHLLHEAPHPCVLFGALFPRKNAREHCIADLVDLRPDVHPVVHEP